MQDLTDFAGVTVAGFCEIKAQPDTAKVLVAVSRVESSPGVAFAKARAGSGTVQQFLAENGFEDFGALRITLSQLHKYSSGEQKVSGYNARIGYSITLHDLDRVEDLLTGVVAAGANEIMSVTFETKRKEELLADARRGAFADAREKAELFCKEAGASVGAIIAIRDQMDPETRMYVRPLLRAAAGGGGGEPIEPAMITISSSVLLTFAIAPLANTQT